MRRAVDRTVLLPAALAFLVFGLAPTVGDIGSCGQEPDELDAKTFFLYKRALDCQRCGDCGLRSTACQGACGATPALIAFPDGCHPFVHDGEVCLHALLIASCDDYASYVRDDAPTAPSECQFCPVP